MWRSLLPVVPWLPAPVDFHHEQNSEHGHWGTGRLGESPQGLRKGIDA